MNSSVAVNNGPTDASNESTGYISDNSLPDLEIEEELSNSSCERKSQELHTRRLVDMRHMWNSLKNLKHAGFGCDFYDIEIISEKRFVLAAFLERNAKFAICLEAFQPRI